MPTVYDHLHLSGLNSPTLCFTQITVHQLVHTNIYVPTVYEHLRLSGLNSAATILAKETQLPKVQQALAQQGITAL